MNKKLKTTTQNMQPVGQRTTQRSTVVRKQPNNIANNMANNNMANNMANNNMANNSDKYRDMEAELIALRKKAMIQDKLLKKIKKQALSNMEPNQ